MIILEITTKKVHQEYMVALGQRLDTYSKYMEANQN